MDWNRFKSFYYVAKDGTFTAASERLNLTQSSVSRQVMNLEEDLRVKLFMRRKKSVRLTKAGSIYYDAVEKMIGGVNQASTAILDLQKEPSGLLRIASTMGVCHRLLVQHMGKFVELYPNLRLRIVNSDDAPQFSAREIDAAILPSGASPPDYIRKFLVNFRLGLFASNGYLRQFGTPKCPEELDYHTLLSYGNHVHPYKEMDWFLSLESKKSKPRTPYLQVNLGKSLCALAQQDIGIVTLEKTYGIKAGLVEVLPDIQGPNIDLYYIYPEYLKQCRKVHVLGQFLREMAAQEYGEGK